MLCLSVFFFQTIPLFLKIIMSDAFLLRIFLNYTFSYKISFHQRDRPNYNALKNGKNSANKKGLGDLFCREINFTKFSVKMISRKF